MLQDTWSWIQHGVLQKQKRSLWCGSRINSCVHERYPAKAVASFRPGTWRPADRPVSMGPGISAAWSVQALGAFTQTVFPGMHNRVNSPGKQYLLPESRLLYYPARESSDLPLEEGQAGFCAASWRFRALRSKFLSYDTNPPRGQHLPTLKPCVSPHAMKGRGNQRSYEDAACSALTITHPGLWTPESQAFHSTQNTEADSMSWGDHSSFHNLAFTGHSPSIKNSAWTMSSNPNNKPWSWYSYYLLFSFYRWVNCDSDMRTLVQGQTSTEPCKWEVKADLSPGPEFS